MEDLSATVPMSRLLDALTTDPTSPAALAERLADEAGGPLADEVLHELQARGDVLETPDGWVNLVAAAEGTILTHVLTEPERELGVLAAGGDLDLWARLADEGLPWDGGGSVTTRWAIDSPELPAGSGVGLEGPPGWLDRYEAGQLLGLRLRAGVLSIEIVEDHALSDSAERSQHVLKRCMEAAGAALDSYLGGDEQGDMPAALLDDVVAELVRARPGVLERPVVPLGILLRTAGLQVDHGFLRLPGVPIGSDADDLEPAELKALVLAHGVVQALTRGSGVTTDELRQLLGLLAIPVVAEQVADAVELSPLERHVLDQLLAAASGDQDRGHALLLAARSADGNGDFDTAERLFDEAVRCAPACFPAVLGATEYAAARGDVVRTDRLLRQVGTPPDDPIREALRPLLTPPTGVVSRNRPCPCGSGRKHKACCLRDVVHPLPARAPLAYARIVLHSQRPGLFERAGRFVRLVERSHWLLAVDLAVFEGGALEDYLRRRGSLLSADERQMLERWQGTPLNAYEVSDLQRGRSVTLRPLPDGDPVVLKDRAFSQSVERLDLVLARLLWDGEKLALLSIPTLVNRLRRGELLAILAGGYDPERLAAFFGPQPPPRLQNREGHELVLCQATYEADDEGWEELHAYLEPDGPDVLLLTGELPNGETVIRGSVRTSGDVWTMATNSIERFEEMQKLILDVVPYARLLDVSKHPAREAVGSSATVPAPRDPGSTELASEHEAELLDEVTRDYERTWLDTDIPALGGLTPRAAVAAGGGPLLEVRALLDDMAWARRDNPNGMDPGRIRTLLGLADA